MIGVVWLPPPRTYEYCEYTFDVLFYVASSFYLVEGRIQRDVRGRSASVGPGGAFGNRFLVKSAVLGPNECGSTNMMVATAIWHDCSIYLKTYFNRFRFAVTDS